MKTCHAVFYWIFLTVYSLFAHSVHLDIEDNGDSTITIKATIPSEGAAAGGKIVIKNKITGQPIIKDTIPESGELTIRIPNVPYTVTLDMGEEHTITKTGPLFNTQKNKDLIVQKIPQKESTDNGSDKSPPVNRLVIILIIAFGAALFGVLFGILKAKQG